ncbi:MAG: hypothetical protein NVV63_14290 [Opitutus sp.]|nr:hypothetical protein [Opitutus sp.]
MNTTSNSPDSAGRVLLHRQGAGEITEAEIERRARELARIDGRHVETDEDRTQAERELRGETLPDPVTRDRDANRSVSRDPSEPVSNTGSAAPTQEDDNEEAVPERLVIEGADEAQHDLMLAARRKRETP